MALRSAAFRELVEQVTEALADKGVAVPDPGVAEIVEDRTREVAAKDCSSAPGHPLPQVPIAPVTVFQLHERNRTSLNPDTGSSLGSSL